MKKIKNKKFYKKKVKICVFNSSEKKSFQKILCNTLKKEYKRIPLPLQIHNVKFKTFRVRNLGVKNDKCKNIDCVIIVLDSRPESLERNIIMWYELEKIIGKNITHIPVLLIFYNHHRQYCRCENTFLKQVDISRLRFIKTQEIVAFGSQEIQKIVGRIFNLFIMKERDTLNNYNFLTFGLRNFKITGNKVTHFKKIRKILNEIDKIPR